MLLDVVQRQCAILDQARLRTVNDTKGVPQGDVEDFVEPNLANGLFKNLVVVE